MYSWSFYIIFLQSLIQTYMRQNPYYVSSYIFLYYMQFKFKRLMKKKIHCFTLSDKTLNYLINKQIECVNDYIDPYTCILINIDEINVTIPSWFYLCCKSSFKKYKVLVVPFEDTEQNVIYVSETMRYNLEIVFHCIDLNDKLFLIPATDNIVNFATEVKVSLISNPYDSSINLTDALLKNYFSEPRFLRCNDVFSIDVKEYAKDRIYSITQIPSTMYFKITSQKLNGNPISKGCFIVQEETALIQENNINSYLPCKKSYLLPEKLILRLTYKDSDNNYYLKTYPSVLVESSNSLKDCIVPFMKSDIQLHIKPVFLLIGSPGSAIHEIVKITSETMGLHLLNIDFGEVQALTSAQTEAKLRILMHNANKSAPCILCLNNIQIFGKTFEGQKDERIISAFAREINDLYSKTLNYPVIIIATSDGSEIPGELHRIFTETINLESLDRQKRMDIIKWQLACQRINYDADLLNIAELCSDFQYKDLIALTLHTIKIYCKRTKQYSEHSITLTKDDFVEAYKYIQSINMDSKGMPRIPEVYWNDIGGLENLKHEITRRIRLPMLSSFNFGQSGLLLYGPPGTGKTLLAKAVATEYQLHFLSVKGPEVLNMYVGQSEQNVRQVFERARSAAPCIIFFDELDSLAPNRGRSGDSGGVMDRVVSQLLAEMDGLDRATNIFIIGATNRPDLIDPALLRPGRFDKLLYVGIHSTFFSKLNVLEALTHKFKFLNHGRELIQLIIDLPINLTGADLYSICSNAWLNAARRVLNTINNMQDNLTKENYLTHIPEQFSHVTVELLDFKEAINNWSPSVSEEEMRRYEKMQKEFSSRQVLTVNM
ncbi:peroxisome assembly factor 2 isoform X1 [Vespa crabro]|uniref:peroxisome assembly factor 2 isoform X1 n=1 Tax=Vespa crabro TaxID=7445 RepID=UPI001F02B09D|nr:peroxisome assembly factor 2 isoform X1 [Vespa crabro]XP_046829887.1 peroxisome assembly factor 2 isoform X1 [Vespa crabro]